MFTMIWRLAEIGRQPTPALHVGDEVALESARADGAPPRAATVCGVRTPFAGRPFSFWNEATAVATRSS